jgi:hypothetical protein
VWNKLYQRRLIPLTHIPIYAMLRASKENARTYNRTHQSHYDWSTHNSGNNDSHTYTYTYTYTNTIVNFE